MVYKTRLKIIIYSVLFIIAVISLIWWSFFNLARGRDYDRLADMRILESHLNSYFFRFNTYEIPECSSGMLVNFCNGSGDNTLAVSSIIDPINNGDMRYVMSSMSNNDFQVEFYLETGLAGLKKGKYTLTKEGLGK